MNAPAPKPMMRYGVMRDWLAAHGIAESEVKKLIENDVIKQGFLRKPKKKGEKVRAYYSADQIARDVLGNGT